MEEAHLAENYNVKRARDTHLWFDDVTEHVPHRATAKALLSLFLKNPKEVEERTEARQNRFW